MTTQSNNKMEDKLKCGYCRSANIIKWCRRKTLNRGFIQRYKCKDCGKYFTIDNGFYRMRNTPQKITLCLDLFYKGVSTRQIQSHLQAFYPHNSSWVSIYSWVIKYSKLIGKFTNKLKINVGKEMQVDEMEYKTRGKQSWFIDCIDTESRFMISSEYVKSRGMKEIKRVLQNAKNKTDRQIRIITTDGFMGYPKAINKIFTLKKNFYLGVEHNQVNASQGEGFNHPVERMHNSIRARTKTFRGFHGSVSSANAIMRGYEIYYNFIRKHLALGCCPYELAIPELKDKLNVPNKWLALISEAQNIKR